MLLRPVSALLLAGLLPSCKALLEESFITFEPVKGIVPIHDATIVHDGNDPEAVQIAVRSLASDWEQITGTKPETCMWGSNSTRCSGEEAAIIIGTTDSSLLTTLIDADKLDVSDIEGKWETFKTTVVSEPLPGISEALVIVGSDKRGAAFGVYTLAEQSGQSPLHFWSDVPATKHSKIFALRKTTVHGEPSVKYRGLFINDEAPALTGWWARRHNVSDYTFDSDFYAHVFDLIVRLKGNVLWPAMWASFIPEPGRIFFTDDPKNQQLADDYGVVVSTSHHEPMQRASNEWKNVGKGPWNWLKNRDEVVNFMEKGVERAGNNESYFTLGMRGENDGPIEGGDPIEILRDVIDTQRAMIANQYGNKSAAPQVWTVYKEVQAYYEAGLVPPSDVTLMFADDNWGSIRRLPTNDEREREGGIGVYYHLGYVGSPKSYKWHNTNNLPKVYKELYQAHERGANQIWVINVEDIKPLELPFAFAMDIAWNASRFDFDMIPDYLVEFSRREFGPELAEQAASVLFDYSDLVGRRKYEMIDANTYSILNYHEADRILREWKDVASRARSIHSKLPEDRRDAFYHYAVYPAVAGANYHSIMVNRGRNAQYTTERRNSANIVAEDILDDFATDWDLVLEFDQIAGGKWEGIMSTPKFDTSLDSWRPPSRDVVMDISYVQTRQDFDYGFGNVGIYAQGSDSAAAQGRICASINPAFPTDEEFKPRLPAITPYGPEFLTVDLFHRGDHRKSIAWSAESPYAWLKLSETSGTLSSDQPEQRINVTVEWDDVPEGFTETIEFRVNWEPEPYFDNVAVTILNNKAPKDFHGFPEVDHVMSIEAPHFQRSSDGDVSFKRIPYLASRSMSGSVALRPFHDARDDTSAAEEAWVEYDIFLFGDDTVGDLKATIYVNAGLDTDPDLPMKYSLSLDGAEANFTRLLLEPSEAGELPDDWVDAVADSIWKRSVPLGDVKPGKHTLRFGANSPELYLEKIVVEFNQTVPYSYLGPPETSRL